MQLVAEIPRKTNGNGAGTLSDRALEQIAANPPTIGHKIKAMVAKAQTPTITVKDVVSWMLMIILPVIAAMITNYAVTREHSLQIQNLREKYDEKILDMQKDLKLQNQNHIDYVRETEKRLSTLETKQELKK